MRERLKLVGLQLIICVAILVIMWRWWLIIVPFYQHVMRIKEG